MNETIFRQFQCVMRSVRAKLNGSEKNRMETKIIEIRTAHSNKWNTAHNKNTRKKLYMNTENKINFIALRFE